MRSKTAILGALLLLLSLGGTTELLAQKYLPPGYGQGQSSGSAFGFDSGVSEIDQDYYLKFAPTFELPVFMFRVGLTVPLEILIYDKEPKTGEKIPSIRPQSFDEREDYFKMIKYITYGTHLYYNPGDLFNWSFHYGQMTDGYIGHRTIIHRYVSSYDNDVYKPGLMADINNDWGGVEAFNGDVLRKEVVGGRGYVRPIGIITGVHDLLFASGPSMSDVRIARMEARDPLRNGGVFFQERIPDSTKGSLRQQFHKPLSVDLDEYDTVEFKEVEDPNTGERKVIAVKPEQEPEQEEPPEKKASRWSPSFWNRWAVGYTVVRDEHAPLDLELDGSGNLVIDPDLKRPRGSDDETLEIVGVDTELRLSPFSFMDITPYYDFNTIQGLENSWGKHYGIDSAFRIGSALRLYFRPEYRELRPNYIPAYFDNYYSIERTVYNPGGDGSDGGEPGAATQTKLNYLKSLDSDGELLKGYFVELRGDLLETLVITGTYENYEGPNNSQVFVGFYVPNIMDAFINGYYTKKNFDKFGESFKFDDRSLAAAEIGYYLFAGFYLKVTGQRTWEYDETNSSYTPVDEINYGFGYGGTF